jgi:hypothetical protein
MYAWVSVSQVRRERAIMWIAALSFRSPLRDSRWRTVLPDDAGMGVTPARRAKAA